MNFLIAEVEATVGEVSDAGGKRLDEFFNVFHVFDPSMPVSKSLQSPVHLFSDIPCTMGLITPVMRQA